MQTKNAINIDDINEIRNDLKRISNQQLKDLSGMITRLSQDNNANGKQIELLKTSVLQNEKNITQELSNLHQDINIISSKFNNLVIKIENHEVNNTATTNRKYSRNSVQTNANLFESSITSFETPVQGTLNTNNYDFESHFKRHKIQIDLDLRLFKSELLKMIKEKIVPLEEQLMQSRSHYESITLELKDKLSWLPMSLNELNGMSPSDARLFTLESRLRAEENSRIQALATIEKSLENIKKNSLSPLFIKNGEKKKNSKNKYSFDLFNNYTEPADRKTPSCEYMDGVIYDNFDNRRNKSSLKSRKSVDLNKELQSLRKINPSKLFKKK